MPRPLCFLTSLFEQEFDIADSSKAGEKEEKHVWSSHIPLFGRNSPAGPSPSPSPRPVFCSMGAAHIGYGKVRMIPVSFAG